jgi:DNA-binding LytR/AlgR family response regulator
MLGVIPFAFFTVSNFQYLFFPDILHYYNQSDHQSSLTNREEIVHISSQLKKEELSFFPAQLIYAESDGNYVVFHLMVNGKYVKKTIRNSINDIEQQLSYIPFIMRIHRAFIVNLKKVSSKKGNTLGYRLKISDLDIEIPVSSNKTRNFNQRMLQFN